MNRWGKQVSDHRDWEWIWSEPTAGWAEGQSEEQVSGRTQSRAAGRMTDLAEGGNITEPVFKNFPEQKKRAKSVKKFFKVNSSHSRK